MIGRTSWIGSSYEVVFLSAVILLHQVCDASEYQHDHKVIVADNILLCIFIMQHRSVYKQVSTLHVLCSDVCCIAEIIIQKPIASALYWAWPVKVLSGLLPACASVFVLALHVVCVVL